MAAKLAKMRIRAEQGSNQEPSDSPTMSNLLPKQLPPKPNVHGTVPNSFGNNNGPSKPKPLPGIPPRKESIAENNNPLKSPGPSPTKPVSAVQQMILDAQARAREQNATSPPVS